MVRTLVRDAVIIGHRYIVGRHIRISQSCRSSSSPVSLMLAAASSAETISEMVVVAAVAIGILLVGVIIANASNLVF